MEYFKNFDDIINDLRAVVPLEKPLTEKQDINIVMLTVSRVMMNIQKSSQYNFTNEEQKVYSMIEEQILNEFKTKLQENDNQLEKLRLEHNEIVSEYRQNCLQQRKRSHLCHFEFSFEAFELC